MKKTKKLLAVVLSVIFIISVIPFAAFTALAATEGYFKYEVKGGKVTITGLVDEEYSGAIKIPATINSYPVTSIGNSAFENCYGLTSVTIANNVISIGRQAFCFCTKLASIIIPDSVEEIGANAFLFTDWYNNQPNGLIYAGKVAYEYKGICPSSITIKDGTFSISSRAFSDCLELTSITIPNSVTKIGEQAFYNCQGLTSMEIPDSVTCIGCDAFYGTVWYHNQPAGIIYAGKVAYKYKGECPASVTIKKGTVGIADFAFCNCSQLTSIIIPDSVTLIGESAFSNCVKLASITIPNSVTFIGESALKDCFELKSVSISKSLTTISDSAFYGCWELTSIILPDLISSIGSYAFSNSGLVSIKIPDSVTSIGEGAFEWCNLKSIYYTGTEKQRAKININNEYGSNYWLLNAKWYYDYGKVYKITYKLNGGTNSSGNPKSFTATTATITLKNPTRSGYTFKGWYSDSGYKTKVTKIAKGTAKNITLYAKWEKAYTVTYKLNSGTNNSANPKTFTATTATITLKNPTRKGYTFKGWYSGAKFKTKVTKITKGTKKNITLYAKWAINTYKITYKLNSGKNNAKNPKSYKVTTATIALKNPTRKGYTFKGWYSDSKYKTKVTKIAKGSTGNKTLYAKWAKK